MTFLTKILKVSIFAIAYMLLAHSAFASIPPKFKVSSNDTSPGYLNGKLVCGTGMTCTEGNDGGDETFTITNGAVTANGAQEFLYIEGATADSVEHIIGSIDPTTSDKTFLFPDANLAAGDVVVGSTTSTAAYVNLANTNILIGDGSGAPAAVSLSGDATLANTGALTIANNAVALGTDTTGNYIATIADAGNSTVTVSGSGSETAAITIDVIDVNCSNCIDGTDIALGSDAQGDVMYYSGTDWVRLAAGTNGQYLQTQGSGANPQWQTPSGAGDMLRATYDTNSNNVVDTATALAANGANCSPGSYALGVDASGAAEGCTAVSVVFGSDTQVSFNDGGTMAGDAEHTWDKTSDTLFVKNFQVKSSGSSNIPFQVDFPTGSFTGTDNLLIGDDAGKSITSGSQNIFIGARSGDGSTSNSNNVCIGVDSCTNAAIGSSNTFVGTAAGSNCGGAGACGFNTGFGENALLRITSGANNNATGYDAGAFINTGSSNTLMGTYAGRVLTTGSHNIILGNETAYDTASAAVDIANTFIAGSITSQIDNVYFGRGMRSATATGYTINGTQGFGSDKVGGDVTIAGGRGTGSGTPGNIIFQASSAEASSSTLQTLATQMTISGSGVEIASVLEIPNGTGPTVDAAGEIAVDTTDDQLVYYSTAKRVIPYTQERCFTAQTPATTDDNVPVWSPVDAITITGVYCRTQGGTSVGITLSDGTNALEEVVCDSDGQADDGSIANGTFTADERVEYDTGTVTGTVDWVNVCLRYTVDAQ